MYVQLSIVKNESSSRFFKPTVNLPTQNCLNLYGFSTSYMGMGSTTFTSIYVVTSSTRHVNGRPVAPPCAGGSRTDHQPAA